MDTGRSGKSEKYPLTLQRIRAECQELGEKYRKLLHELQLPRVGFGDIFRELNLGIHDEALAKTVGRSVAEPLRQLFSVLAKLQLRVQDLERQMNWYESQKSYKEKLTNESESIAFQLMAAFEILLKEIAKGREAQKSAIKMIEKDIHAKAREISERGREAHPKLTEGIRPITELLSIHERAIAGSKKSTSEEIENIILEIRAVYDPWKAIFGEYQANLVELEKVYEDFGAVQELVLELCAKEEGLLSRLRIWEGLFNEAQINPYDYLGIKPEAQALYAAEKSNLPECNALLSIALPDLQQVKSLFRLSERVESLLEKLEHLKSEIKSVFAPKPGPRLVAPKVPATMKETSVEPSISAMQLALSLYAILCGTKNSRGRTAKVAYEQILKVTGFTFGLEYKAFCQGLKEAKLKNLMNEERRARWWLWKPTPEGFSMGETLVKFLPADFEKKIRKELKNLNEFQRLMNEEYRKKKTGQSPAS